MACVNANRKVAPFRGATFTFYVKINYCITNILPVLFIKYSTTKGGCSFVVLEQYKDKGTLRLSTL